MRSRVGKRHGRSGSRVLFRTAAGAAIPVLLVGLAAVAVAAPAGHTTSGASRRRGDVRRLGCAT
jgi:hypothetical protein